MTERLRTHSAVEPRNFVLFWALIYNLMGVLVRVPYFYCSGAHCSGVRVFCSKA